MGLVSKSSVKFSVLLYIGIVLGYLNTVLIFPRVLSEEEFGLTRILASAAAVIGQFALLGADNIIIRFSPYFKNDKQNIILSIGLIISTIGLALTGLILFIFHTDLISLYEDKSPLFVKYTYLLIPFVISIVFFNLFDSYLRVIFKNITVVFLNFIVLRIAWLVVVLVYFMGWVDTTTFLLLYVGCQAGITLIAFAYLLHIGAFNISFKLNKATRDNLKSIGWFGFFTIISGLSFFLINKVDVLMVGKFMGLADVAIYSIAFSMSSVILVPSQAIARTVMVLIADATKRNDRTHLKDLYKKTALNQLILGMLIFTLIALNYRLLMFFLPEFFRDSFYIFLFLGLSKIIDTAFGMNGSIIINSKYYRVDTALSCLLLLITFITNIYFIPRYGVEGAAFATALSISLFNILKFLFLKIKMNLSPFDVNYLIGFMICLTGYFLPSFLPSVGNMWWDGIIKSIFILTIFTGLTYFSHISEEFNQLLSELVNSVKKVFKFL